MLAASVLALLAMLMVSGVLPPISYRSKGRVSLFASLVNNFLRLNLDKLELLPMSSGSSQEECSIQIGTHTVSSSNSVKCLGIIWSSNLSPKAAIGHNIYKAHRPFFTIGALGTT